MTLASPKVSPPMAAFPRSVSSIAIAMGGLATFFVFASWLLVSYPISSSVGGYFNGIDTAKQTEISVSPGHQTITTSHQSSDSEVGDRVLPSAPSSELPGGSSDSSTDKDLAMARKNFSSPASNESSPDIEIREKSDQESEKEEETKTVPESMDRINISSSEIKSINLSDVSQTEAIPAQSSLSSNASEDTSAKPECDLYHGSWFYDPLGPVYTNNSCPVLTQMQNCQGNGRPDKDYESWRWKPSQCELPRFDANKFFELMRGKTLAFIGDSVARNQMESMICLLWQVEAPINRGNRKMQRWYFRSARVMIVRIWSSWLVRQFSEPFDFAPQGVTKLQLDAPDERIMDAAPQFDVVVLSSGHWFAKPSVYILNNEIVGGQLWWPDKSKPMKVNNIEAFGISVETILSAMATHTNYTGLTIVRSFSPDHYEGGAWNTGGSCTGKVKPLGAGELVKNGFTEIMHEKQVNGFNRAVNKAADKSRMKLMDITEVFGYRHDGHPGPYRNPDPNKITKRGPDGRPPPQDCLHWCMPGPVDTWNEMVLEIIRRKFEGRQSSG